MPDGWVYRWSGDTFPGLLLRIRRKDGDKVRFFGFARKFAPEREVAARDQAFRDAVQAEFLENLRKKQLEKKDGADKGKNPDSPVPGVIILRDKPKKGKVRPKAAVPKRPVAKRAIPPPNKKSCQKPIKRARRVAQ